MEFNFKDNKVIVGILVVLVICGLIAGVVYANREENDYEGLENFDNGNTVLNGEDESNFEENGGQESEGKHQKKKDEEEGEKRRK